MTGIAWCIWICTNSLLIFHVVTAQRSNDVLDRNDDIKGSDFPVGANTYSPKSSGGDAYGLSRARHYSNDIDVNSSPVYSTESSSLEASRTASNAFSPVNTVNSHSKIPSSESIPVTSSRDKISDAGYSSTAFSIPPSSKDEDSPPADHHSSTIYHRSSSYENKVSTPAHSNTENSSTFSDEDKNSLSGRHSSTVDSSSSLDEDRISTPNHSSINHSSTSSDKDRNSFPDIYSSTVIPSSSFDENKVSKPEQSSTAYINSSSKPGTAYETDSSTEITSFPSNASTFTTMPSHGTSYFWRNVEAYVYTIPSFNGNESYMPKEFQWIDIGPSFPDGVLLSEDFEHIKCASRGEEGHFLLNRTTGRISMSYKTQSKYHTIYCSINHKVKERRFTSTIYITVTPMLHSVLDSSGSFTLQHVTAEDFLSTQGSASLVGRLIRKVRSLFNFLSDDRLEVYQVLERPEKNGIDVRMVMLKSDGSVSRHSRALNSLIMRHRAEIEADLNLTMTNIGLETCNVSCKTEECESNVFMKKYATPIEIGRNTSFVGLVTKSVSSCGCQDIYVDHTIPCGRHNCLHTNRCNYEHEYGCVCPEGYNGPNCERNTAAYLFDSSLWFPVYAHCTSITLKFKFISANMFSSGILIYSGPLSRDMGTGYLASSSYFLAVELTRYKTLKVYLRGDRGTTTINYDQLKIEPRTSYDVSLETSTQSGRVVIELSVHKSSEYFSTPYKVNTRQKHFSLSYPLQLGGTKIDLEDLKQHYKWDDVPRTDYFNGVIKDLSLNEIPYDLGEPMYSEGFHPYVPDIYTETTTEYAYYTPDGYENYQIVLYVTMVFVVLFILVATVTICVCGYAKFRRQDRWRGVVRQAPPPNRISGSSVDGAVRRDLPNDPPPSYEQAVINPAFLLNNK